MGHGGVMIVVQLPTVSESFHISEAVMIAITFTLIIVSVLLIIALLLGLFKRFIYKEEPKPALATPSPVAIPVQDDEEEKLVATLAATILAAEKLGTDDFRITKITRTK